MDDSRGACPSSALDRGQNGAASLTEEPSSLPDHVHSVLKRRQASTEERELLVAAHSPGLQTLPTGPARAGPGLHVAGTEPEHPQGLSTSSSPSLAREELFPLQGTSCTIGHVRAADAAYCCQSNGHFSPTEGIAHQHPPSLESGLLQGQTEDVQNIIADHSKPLLQLSGAGEGASCMDVEMLACKAPKDPSTAVHDGRQKELAGPGPHARCNGFLASQGVPCVSCCPDVQDQEAGGTIPTVQPKHNVEGLTAEPAALNKLLFQVFEDPAQHTNLAGQPTLPAETALQLEPQDSLRIGPGQTSSSDPVHADFPRQLVPCPDVDDSSRSAGDIAHVEDSNLQCSGSCATADGPALGSAAVKTADLSAEALRGSVLGRHCAPKLQPELQPTMLEARNANCPAPAHSAALQASSGRKVDKSLGSLCKRQRRDPASLQAAAKARDAASAALSAEHPQSSSPTSVQRKCSRTLIRRTNPSEAQERASSQRRAPKGKPPKGLAATLWTCCGCGRRFHVGCIPPHQVHPTTSVCMCCWHKHEEVSTTMLDFVLILSAGIWLILVRTACRNKHTCVFAMRHAPR